jgi:hypothetical protein
MPIMSEIVFPKAAAVIVDTTMTLPSIISICSPWKINQTRNVQQMRNTVLHNCHILRCKLCRQYLLMKVTSTVHICCSLLNKVCDALGCFSFRNDITI